jgi:hypothetical protein
LLIACTESDGVATKKSRSGIVRPAVMPFAQEMPRVSVCADGTRTA